MLQEYTTIYRSIRFMNGNCGKPPAWTRINLEKKKVKTLICPLSSSLGPGEVVWLRSSWLYFSIAIPSQEAKSVKLQEITGKSNFRVLIVYC